MPFSYCFALSTVVIVDKDNAPKWDPPTLEGVTTEMLDHFFSPLKDRDLFVA